MQNESSIKEMIKSSLEQVRTIIDADTIVGKQIITPSGVVIIPISKVSMGFASGGLDLPSKSPDRAKSFGGGGGTGITVSPLGFLTVSPTGEVDMIPMVTDKPGTLDQIADLLASAPSMINRVKNFFQKDEDEESVDLEKEASRVAKDAEEALDLK